MVLRDRNVDFARGNDARRGLYSQFMGRRTINETNDNSEAAIVYIPTISDPNSAGYSIPQPQSTEFRSVSDLGTCNSPTLNANYSNLDQSVIPVDPRTRRLTNNNQCTVGHSEYHGAPTVGLGLQELYNDDDVENDMPRDEFQYKRLKKGPRPNSHPQYNMQDIHVIDDVDRNPNMLHDFHGPRKIQTKSIQSSQSRPKSTAILPPDPLACGCLRPSNVEVVKSFLYSRFEALMVKTSKAVGSCIIEAICPLKKSDFPYPRAKGHQYHEEKPSWWPGNIRYASPHRMQKPDLLELLTYVVALPLTNTREYFALCEHNEHARHWESLLNNVAFKLYPRYYDSRELQAGTESEEAIERTKARIAVLKQINRVAGITALLAQKKIDSNSYMHYGPVPDACFHKTTKGQILSQNSNKGRKRQKTGELKYDSTAKDSPPRASGDHDKQENKARQEEEKGGSVPAEAIPNEQSSSSEIISQCKKRKTSPSRPYLRSEHTSVSTLESSDSAYAYTDPSVSSFSGSEFEASHPISDFGLNTAVQAGVGLPVGGQSLLSLDELGERTLHQPHVADSMAWFPTQEQQGQMYPAQLNHGLSPYVSNRVDPKDYFENDFETSFDNGGKLDSTWSQSIQYNLNNTIVPQLDYTYANEIDSRGAHEYPRSEMRWA